MQLLVQEGAKDIPLGTPVAIIVSKKEDIAAFANFTPEAAQAAPKAPAATQAAAPVKSAETKPAAEAAPAHDSYKGRVFASPLARREAIEKGIDIASVKGSGPGG